MKERIDKYLKYLKEKNGSTWNVSSFESEVGLSNGYFSKTEIPRKEKYEIIKKHLPGLNMLWLIYGEGTMVKSDDENISERLSEQAYTINLQKDVINNLKEKVERLENELEKYKPNMGMPAAQ